MNLIGECPPYQDSIWWECYAPRMRDNAVTGRDWVNAVALAHGIGRHPASLTSDELEVQRDAMDRRMGRKFFQTWPVGWR
jgi:hypothetical protein